MKEPPKAYQVKATLNNIRPPVWRRILISDKITLLDLHDMIQAVFGWEDYHLHEFTIRGVQYGDPANDEYGDRDIQNEARTKLRTLDLVKGARFTYEYDFGDSWVHTLLVEKTFPIEKGMKLPQCIAGKRACPPEDVGGPWGYQGFLEAINDPNDEEHERYVEWIGGEFDPEAFDLEAVNERLRQRGRRDWGGSLPAEAEESAQKSLFDSTRLSKLLSAEGEKTAQTLPLRQDVVTLLTYLKDHPVTGTQSTGNFTRKAIVELSSLFVHPPVLERKFGETIFRFRTEEDVWPVYFIHVLAQGAELVSGGPSRRWKLTRAGEEFLSLPVVIQVWILFAAWWLRTNWLIAYPVILFGEFLPERFSISVLAALKTVPVDQPVPFDSFADQVVETVGWTWPKQEPNHIRGTLHVGIERMVIDPLEDFGMVSTERQRDPDRLLDIRKLRSFTLTNFGRAMLDSL